MLDHVKKELERADARQLAEKVGGAAALAVKAYAYWRERRRLTSHGELWEYVEKLVRELGDWVLDAWNAGNAMHTCFYEGWCGKWHVKEALRRVERLVGEIKARLYASPHGS